MTQMAELLKRRERFRISRIDQVIARGHRAGKERLEALSPDGGAFLKNDVIDASLGFQKDGRIWLVVVEPGPKLEAIFVAAKGGVKAIERWAIDVDAVNRIGPSQIRPSEAIVNQMVSDEMTYAARAPLIDEVLELKAIALHVIVEWHANCPTRRHLNAM